MIEPEASAGQDTRSATLYLRGLAICCVLVNHYLNSYISVQFAGYAHAIVSVFFVLSGYGTFLSFEKHRSSGRDTVGLFSDYLARRGVRVLPLYWISLLVLASVDPRLKLSMSMVIPVFQSPFRAYDIYWFVTAILQCYLAAPVLYYIFRKGGIAWYVTVVSLLFVGSYAYGLAGSPFSKLFLYGGFFFGYFFLFALGMLLAGLRLDEHTYTGANLILASTFFVFAAMVYIVHGHAEALDRLTPYISPVFILSSFLFCAAFIAGKPAVLFGRLITLLGAYSYSLYLFHQSYYVTLARLGLIRPSRGSLNIVVTVAIFPVFFMFCVAIETLTRYLSGLLFDRRGRRRETLHGS